MKYQNENFNGVLDYRSNFHNGWLVEMHLHEYSEVLYCKSGEGMVTVNGQQIMLRKQQFIWLPPNYIHQYAFHNSELICAVFSNDLIPLFFHSASKKQLIVSALDAEELQPIFDILHTIKKENYLLISGYLNLICAKVIAKSTFEEPNHPDLSLYQKVITYLSEHYTEDVTLRKLAKKFGYNEKYLSHALHTLTGINFRQFLTFYRLSHAKKLLESRSDANITTIAAESGFSAMNTFHRTFKEMLGITPSEYRKKFGNR